MGPFLQPPLLAEEGGHEVGDSSTTTAAPPNAMAMTEDMTIASETSLSDEHHQQQQEEMSSRIPLDPSLASSSPLLSSSSVRHPLHIHHRRQPTGFHEKQLGDDSRGRSDLHYATTSKTTMNASSGRRSITLRLLGEITPLPQPAPTPLRQSPLLLRRFRSISLSGRAFAVVSNAAAAANIAETDASASDVVVDESKSDIVRPLKESENGIENKDINSSSSGGEEKCRVVDHGIITISWYDGTTSNEMQEHVYNCVLRKLNSERKTDEIAAEGKIKLEDVRLLDEHVEVVLCPFLPDGSTFVLKFKVSVDRLHASSLHPPAAKVSQQPALPPWYIPRAPESPSAEPDLHERFADRTLADGNIVPSLGNSVVVQHQEQQHLEVQRMLGAVATLLQQQQQQQQQQSGGKGGVRRNELQLQSPYFDSNAQSNGQLPPLPDVEEESVLISRISSFAAPRDDEKKEDDEDAEDDRSTFRITPIWNSPVKLTNNLPLTPGTTLLTSTTTDRLIEEQLRQLNELLRRRQSPEFVQSSDGGGVSSSEVVPAASKALPDDQDQANLVRAYHRNEKKQVMFMISNYLVLFLSLIALSAEIQSRLPQWMAWVQQNYDSVQNCATDQGALMECLSSGDFSGLVAGFLLWATQSASAKRIFLFGFDTPKKLWTVVYEALVTAACYGTSYLFIQRGLNPNTRQNFLQYWKDAIYGSLAGFNAAFMKAVLKNLVPQEVALEALDGRQLRIRNWIHWLMTDE